MRGLFLSDVSGVEAGEKGSRQKGEGWGPPLYLRSKEELPKEAGLTNAIALLPGCQVCALEEHPREGDPCLASPGAPGQCCRPHHAGIHNPGQVGPGRCTSPLVPTCQPQA